jgi:hypothetical protein
MLVVQWLHLNLKTGLIASKIRRNSYVYRCHRLIFSTQVSGDYWIFSKAGIVPFALNLPVIKEHGIRNSKRSRVKEICGSTPLHILISWVCNYMPRWKKKMPKAKLNTQEHIWRNEGICMVNLETRCRWVVSFVHLSLYRGKRENRYPPNGSLGGPRNWSVSYGKDKSSASTGNRTTNFR